jgi:hypothetical protein
VRGKQTQKRRREGGEYRASVREMLFRDWDPIGISEIAGAPTDEYDRYADRVFAMFCDDQTTEKSIAAYLYEVATASMGLSEHGHQTEKANRVAKRLVELRAEMGKPTPYELGEHLFGRCGSGLSDLASNHKKYFREKMHAKHGRRR